MGFTVTLPVYAYIFYSYLSSPLPSLDPPPSFRPKHSLLLLPGHMVLLLLLHHLTPSSSFVVYVYTHIQRHTCTHAHSRIHEFKARLHVLLRLANLT